MQDTLARVEGVLLGPAAGALLGDLVAADGASLDDWRLRAVHRHGSSGSSVVYVTDITEADGTARSVLHVLHVSDRRVPATTEPRTVEGVAVHGWRFPRDPYLPGLGPAVNRRATRRLLDQLAVAAGRPSLRTVSYRPSRRAVVAVSLEDGGPAVHRKVLGGRSASRVAARATAVAAVHDALVEHLPVPPVLDLDADRGLVTLATLPGTSLRQRLRRGDVLPPADALVDLVGRLGTVPDPDTGTDPTEYADVERHARLLARLAPERAAMLAELTDAVRRLGGPVGVVHGDLHDGQLLVDDAGVTGLLDLDGVGVGPLAHDAGRLVANIEVATLHRDTDAAAADAASAFAEAVAAGLEATVPRRLLATAAAGAWVALATGPHRVRSEGWQDAVRDRLAHAAAWFELATA